MGEQYTRPISYESELTRDRERKGHLRKELARFHKPGHSS